MFGIQNVLSILRRGTSPSHTLPASPPHCGLIAMCLFMTGGGSTGGAGGAAHPNLSIGGGASPPQL